MIRTTIFIRTMKNLLVAFFVISSAMIGESFKCYQCGTRKDESYTEEECEKVQTLVDCPDHLKVTCFKQHIIEDDETKIEKRGCQSISDCEKKKKECENDAKDDEEKIKECAVACCISEGDTPCNGGYGAMTGSTDLIMMVVVAVVSSLTL